MIIKNNEIKNLLLSKKPIVESGRALSAVLEEQAREISDAEMVKRGLSIDGDNYTGTYQTLNACFGVEGATAISELVKSVCSDNLQELQSKQMLIANINEQVNSILTADMHTYGLEEFEEITEVSVDEEGNVVAVVVNSVDEFIKRFKEQRAKNSVDNTRLTAS